MKKKRKESVDRLSDLPDCILQHILSLLETKHAVRTCVLSKRWRFLWASVPDLNFTSESDFDAVSFKKFVGPFLGLRDPLSKVRKFCSTIYEERSCDDFHLSEMIKYALSHGAEHLELHRHWRYHQLFSWKTLKTLHLERFNFSDPCGFSTTLTTLSLKRCWIYDPNGSEYVDSAEYFELFSFPNLINFSLVQCTVTTLRCLKIWGPQLINLTLEDLDTSLCAKMDIYAPKATFFKFTGIQDLDFGLVYLPCVREANIDTNFTYFLGIEGYEGCYSNFIKLLQGIQNAQLLTLSSDTIEDLAGTSDILEHQPPRFCNLKCLKLKMELNMCTSTRYSNSLAVPFKVISNFLNGSPYAETMLVDIQPPESFIDALRGLKKQNEDLQKRLEEEKEHRIQMEKLVKLYKEDPVLRIGQPSTRKSGSKNKPHATGSGDH